MKLKPILLKHDPLQGDRNIITTILLYGVFVMALLFSLVSTFDMVDRFVEFAGVPHNHWMFHQNGETFFEWVAYNYGKGWIPGWLIGMVAGICNYRIIRGHRDGVCWMLISFYVICFPTLFVELEEFLYFSISTLATVIVYWAFLFLTKKGKMYWSICKCSPNWLSITTVVVIMIWTFMIISSYHHFELHHRYSGL